MVFEKNKRPTKKGEKQTDVPETLDVAPSGEVNVEVAVAEKGLYIKKKDLDQVVDAGTRFLTDQKSMRGGNSVGWSELIGVINPLLKIGDYNVIKEATDKTVIWEKEKRAETRGQTVAITDKMIAYIGFLGFDIPNAD